MLHQIDTELELELDEGGDRKCNPALSRNFQTDKLSSFAEQVEREPKLSVSIVQL